MSYFLKKLRKNETGLHFLENKQLPELVFVFICYLK
jgi:hypothetical protein